jgi:dipeptidyl-peptidase-4
MPSPTTEYGFLVLSLGTRAQPGLGRGVLDSIYLKLGQTEVDDLAAGVRAIASRPYVDAARVGIYGTSYGGYASLMALLRYPGVFAAASASSAPVDWRLYDTIYTERYMSTPDANAAGYDAGSALTHVGDLRGALLVYFGTADNNVHPSNALQLIQACARAGKSIDVQVGADLEHSSVPFARMMQFFVERLALAPERAQAEREVARRFP